MPPAAWPSPAVSQPSPAAVAPRPGRAWNMCQMNGSRVLGLTPLIAMRKRRPKPRIARPGPAVAKALVNVSDMSWATRVVAIVTGAGARLLLRSVKDLVHRAHDRLRPVLVEERAQAALAGLRRADHGAQVAHEVVRVTDVRRDHLQHVVAQRARVVELERRDPEALLPDLGRARVVGAVGRAADVALV